MVEDRDQSNTAKHRLSVSSGYSQCVMLEKEDMIDKISSFVRSSHESRADPRRAVKTNVENARATLKVGSYDRK